jgi:hypothetical protein
MALFWKHVYVVMAYSYGSLLEARVRYFMNPIFLHSIHTSLIFVVNYVCSMPKHIRWKELVARITEMENQYKILVGKSEWKRADGRPKRTWIT